MTPQQTHLKLVNLSDAIEQVLNELKEFAWKFEQENLK